MNLKDRICSVSPMLQLGAHLKSARRRDDNKCSFSTLCAILERVAEDGKWSRFHNWSDSNVYVTISSAEASN